MQSRSALHSSLEWPLHLHLQQYPHLCFLLLLSTMCSSLLA
uniref:Uncharacterized protein n=1 Tax=Setaria viridis TaxID=4556 RepID=A0A4U6UDS4_SETVI|nr:hypothetical protein SEVIR_5G053050v2 [Setaria viridis]